MEFRRSLTRVQKIMASLMTGVFLLLAVWLVPEIAGVISPEAEDTYSEIIFDLPWLAVLAVSALHLVAGVVFVWSAGHFIEGYRRRRGIEKQNI
jgi:cytochrome bd-type quinol oxidase subunit 2